jgi:ribonuclease BN (tRNA processing enzyme)
MDESGEASAASAGGEGRVSRRLVLGTAGAAALAGAAGSPGIAAADTAAPVESTSGTNVVLLGTQAGPPPVVGRAGIASAVVVDGATYLVDCGRSAVTQYQRAGLSFSSLRAIFLTHLHSDHIADYYNFLMLAGFAGLAGFGSTDAMGPVDVYGPASAGQLPPATGGASVPTVNPANPVPGTSAMTTALHASFAYSSNLFLRLAPGISPDIEDLATVSEIVVPDVGASPTGDTAPPMAPFVVMEDDRVRVTAILVPHGNVYPSFAFRFDTDHGSVTFSGDTRQSDNVVALARGSDLLVHEAMSLPASMPPELRAAQLTFHVDVDAVGSVAQRADVPFLALSHIADLSGTLDVDSWRRRAQAGYSGRVLIGQDLAWVPVRRL